ncbi:hypothetical protein [Paracoccus aminovorans]|uniref:hypothetical protein n=1 Tax=Paracoccus aminovorans TaxID=34004 RepID=UPI002B259529|nr:hypothetical protein [Paracoccus aminovorans]
MRSRLPLLIVGLLVLGGLALLFLTGRNAEERRIDGSAVGFALLAPWLDSQGIAAEQANPRLSPQVETLALRILPLHDIDLTQPMRTGGSPRDQFYSGTLIDTDLGNLLSKYDEMSTLVILPKWVAGSFARKVLHRSALIPQSRYPTLLEQVLGRSGARLLRPGDGFRSEDSAWGRIALFQPQVLDPDHLPEGCRSLLDFAGGALVLSCEHPDMPPLYVLADPDLMNNHGLPLARNGKAAAGLLRKILNGDTRPVYLDPYDASYINVWDEAAEDEQRRDYQRDAEAFARFFDPPFDALWAMMLIVLGVAFWRGAVRFGPLGAVDAAPAEQSKSAAIATKARLLRLSGHDGRMVADYVRADLAQRARQTFGPGAAQAGQARLFAHLARRDPAAAEALRQAAEALATRAPHMPPAELARTLHTYRSLLETLTHGHDPDRVPKPR